MTFQKLGKGLMLSMASSQKERGSQAGQKRTGFDKNILDEKSGEGVLRAVQAEIPENSEDSKKKDAADTLLELHATISDTKLTVARRKEIRVRLLAPEGASTILTAARSDPDYCSGPSQSQLGLRVAVRKLKIPVELQQHDGTGSQKLCLNGGKLKCCPEEDKTAFFISSVKQKVSPLQDSTGKRENVVQSKPKQENRAARHVSRDINQSSKLVKGNIENNKPLKL